MIRTGRPGMLGFMGLQSQTQLSDWTELNWNAYIGCTVNCCRGFKILMLRGIGGRRRRGWQRMRWLDGITDRWTWVWVNSRSWWWTGRPGVLRFMGSKRVGHDWVTELHWTEHVNLWYFSFYFHLIHFYWNKHKWFETLNHICLVNNESNLCYFPCFSWVIYTLQLPGGSGSKESACNAGDLASIPELERSRGGGHNNPLQYSYLENPIDRGAW